MKKPSAPVHPSLRGASLAGAMTLAAGCYAPGDADPAGSASQALNGTVTFPNNSGCDADQQQRVRDAMLLVRTAVVDDPSALSACLRDAVTSPSWGHSAEHMVSRLLEDLPTEVRCDDSNPGHTYGQGTWINAHAPVSIADERITFDRTFLMHATSTTARLGSVLLHEVMHNKGYTHAANTEYPHSVNEQVERCFRDITGDQTFDLARRSTMPTEGELQTFGSDSVDEPYAVACPTGAPMAGQSISTTTTIFSSNGVLTQGQLRRLQVRCRAANGSTVTAAGAAGSGGPLATDDCPQGEVVVGVRGNADANHVYRVGFVCGRWSDVVAGVATVATALPERGYSVGQRIERFCPPGSTVMGLRGNADNEAESLRLVCRRWDAGAIRATADLATLGATQATALARRHARDLCQGGGVMVGLYGHQDPTPVRRIGGICRTLRSIHGSSYLGGNEHVTPAAGSNDDNAFGDFAFERRCPEGGALVGVAVGSFSGTTPTTVQGRCANVSAWAQPAPVAAPVTTINATAIPATGALPSDLQTVTCARGQFLAGLGVRSITRANDSRRVVERITAICRAVAP